MCYLMFCHFRGNLLFSFLIVSFQVQFDCKVSKLKFPSHELAFMAAMFTGFDDGKDMNSCYLLGREEISSVTEIQELFEMMIADCC